MTSKQRAYLKGLAMNIDPVFQIGKSSLTPEITQAVDEALEARELIKGDSAEKLSGRRRFHRGCPCRAHTLTGGTGHWQENRSLPSCQRGKET